jgi:hypothetical protein
VVPAYAGKIGQKLAFREHLCYYSFVNLFTLLFFSTDRFTGYGGFG